MIESASLEDEYFVVLTLKGKVSRLANRVQKLIAEHYELYNGGNYPVLHVTIDRIYKDKLNEAVKILNEIIDDIDPIKIKIEEINCFEVSEGDDLLLLDVKNTGSLLSSAELVHNKFIKENISSINNYQDWNFHITIINNNFATNPISKEDFSDIKYLLEDFKVPFDSYADKLEIWQASLKPEERVLKSYNLSGGEKENEK
ncbi:MAG: 2'-5' RNA ligase [Bacillota bacterium]